MSFILNEIWHKKAQEGLYKAKQFLDKEKYIKAKVNNFIVNKKKEQILMCSVDINGYQLHFRTKASCYKGKEVFSIGELQQIFVEELHSFESFDPKTKEQRLFVFCNGWKLQIDIEEEIAKAKADFAKEEEARIQNAGVSLINQAIASNQLIKNQINPKAEEKKLALEAFDNYDPQKDIAIQEKIAFFEKGINSKIPSKRRDSRSFRNEGNKYGDGKRS